MADLFETVRTVGLALPGVETATKYDGSPLLKVGGCFMAGLATHRSAEPGTLVVRVDVEEWEWLLEDAPESYYGASVANRSGRSPRLAVHVVAPHVGEGTTTRHQARRFALSASSMRRSARTFSASSRSLEGRVF